MLLLIKMLLKESIDEKKKEPFLGMSLALRREHAIWLIFMSLFGIDDTASLCLRCFFVTPMWNIPAPFNAATSNASCFCLSWTHAADSTGGRSVNTHTHTQSTLTWGPCGLQSCLTSSIQTSGGWEGSPGLGPYWHDGIVSLLQVCLLHIYDLHPKGALLD